jgi:4-aminobutyrate aminotransferase
MSLSKLAQFGVKHVARGVGRLSTEVLESGSGTSGIGVTNLGHCHPAVTKAAQAQVGRLVHGQVNVAFQKPYLDLIESLIPLMPHKSC